MKRGICIALFNHLITNLIKQHLQNISKVLGKQRGERSRKFKAQYLTIRTLLSSSFTRFTHVY